MAMSPRLLRPLASGFNPRSIANLELWLDASDASTITVSTGVSVWADKSGNGRNATQATGGKQPAYTNTLNGKNIVTFQGTDDTLQIAANAAFNSASQTLIVIARQAAAADEIIWHKSSSVSANGLSIRYRTDRLFVIYSENTAAVLQPLHTVFDPTAANVFSMTMEPSAQGIHINGVVRGTNTVSATYNDNTTVWLGSRRDAGTFLNGDIAEVLFFSRALSPSERSRIEKALGRKWGITVA